jgi:two-component system response regulator YesN
LKNKEQFLLALKENDPRRVFMELEAIFDKIRSFDVLKIEETYPYYMEILFLIINFLNELGEESNEVFERETDFYTTISRFETVFEINNWIKNLVGAMLHYLQEKASIRLHRAVVRACQFVKDNYQEEITLPMIGEFVGLSESHFSRLFAKEMGENFIDYLTKIRITKAKELFVTTNLKVYEIAEKVGYTSAEHFSRIFKRYTGESPSNYKG